MDVGRGKVTSNPGRPEASARPTSRGSRREREPGGAAGPGHAPRSSGGERRAPRGAFLRAQAGRADGAGGAADRAGEGAREAEAESAGKTKPRGSSPDPAGLRGRRRRQVTGRKKWPMIFQ